MNNTRLTTFKLLNTITFLIMIGINALANILPINGQTTGGVSDDYPNLFAPAPLTFSIWGVIYVTLALFILVQFKKDSRIAQSVEKIGPYFWISSVANSLWIFAWHYDQIALSQLFMTIILVCLIFINVNLSNQEPFIVRLPFRIYFGWITIATIANVTTLLVAIGWDGFGLSNEFWTVTILIVGLLIASATAWRIQAIPYVLVVIWAYFGIWIKHTSTNGFNGEYPLIINTVIVSIILLIGVIFMIVRRSKVTH